MKLPYWLLDEDMEQIMLEGAGDIDVLFRRGDRVERHYFQVKDHLVTPGELRAVIQQFMDKDAADPGTFTKFVVVAKGFSEDILRLRYLLERVRGAATIYENTATAAETLADLHAVMTKLDLAVDSSWPLEKVELEDSAHIRTWPDSRAGAVNEFAGALADLPAYAKTLKPALARAFDTVRAHLADNTARALHRDALLGVIQKTVHDFQAEVEQAGLSVFVDHWGDPTYLARLEHDVLFDWRLHFDRDTRRVPLPEVWDTEFVPELRKTERQLRAMQAARQVHVRGGGTLSMGIVLGQTFSKVKGYEVAIQQGSERWSSAAVPAIQTVLSTGSGLTLEDNAGDGLCLEINASRVVGNKVRAFAQAQGITFQGRLTLNLQDETLRFDPGSAVKAAQEIRHHLSRALDQHDFRRVHLFYAGPFGLAVLLGQLLNSVGEVCLYELQIEDGYVRSATLNTA